MKKKDKKVKEQTEEYRGNNILFKSIAQTEGSVLKNDKGVFWR